MAETKQQKIKRLRRERNRRRKLRRNILIRAGQHARRIRILNAAIKRLTTAVPGNINGWHPRAVRTQVHSGIGAFLNVPAKLIWHTTEGSSLPVYSGSHPHFTLNPKTGQLWQHIPITSGAMTVKNLAGGVETNRAHAIQVELIGFAAMSHTWSDREYEHIANLARWIEKNAGVERRCTVKFESRHHSISNSAWLDYKGHIGHQHVPENDHWDPGRLDIQRILR